MGDTQVNLSKVAWDYWKSKKMVEETLVRLSGDVIVHITYESFHEFKARKRSLDMGIISGEKVVFNSIIELAMYENYWELADKYY
jgi:hypothetical protein